MYTKEVLSHFANPKNMGKMKNPDGVGEIGNIKCGDIMRLYIKVEDDKIKDIKFETLGCAAAIASTSMITELVKGKKTDEALKISNKDVAAELEGLPPNKMHCSNLAADALLKAVQDYEKKMKK